MPISPYNHEGYFDPTAYYALTAVDRQQRQERYRPIVCIIAPENVDDNLFRRFAVAQHYIPLCPERMLADAAQDDSLAMFMSIALLLSGIIGLLGDSKIIALLAIGVLLIGLLIGIGCIVAVQKKYNNGIF